MSQPIHKTTERVKPINNAIRKIKDETEPDEAPNKGPAPPSKYKEFIFDEGDLEQPLVIEESKSEQVNTSPWPNFSQDEADEAEDLESSNQSNDSTETDERESQKHSKLGNLWQGKQKQESSPQETVAEGVGKNKRWIGQGKVIPERQNSIRASEMHQREVSGGNIPEALSGLERSPNQLTDERQNVNGENCDHQADTKRESNGLAELWSRIKRRGRTVSDSALKKFPWMNKVHWPNHKRRASTGDIDSSRRGVLVNDNHGSSTTAADSSHDFSMPAQNGTTTHPVDNNQVSITDDPGVSHRSQRPSQGIITAQSDPNFHTKIVSDAERDGEITSSEQVAPDMSFIHEMCRAPKFEQPKPSMRKRIVSLPANLKRRWTEPENKKNKNETRERNSGSPNVSVNPGREIEDVEQNSDELPFENRNIDESTLEGDTGEVKRVFGTDVSSSITRSATIKSMRATIENGSSRAESSGTDQDSDLESDSNHPKSSQKNAPKDQNLRAYDATEALSSGSNQCLKLKTEVGPSGSSPQNASDNLKGNERQLLSQNITRSKYVNGKRVNRSRFRQDQQSLSNVEVEERALHPEMTPKDISEDAERRPVQECESRTTRIIARKPNLSTIPESSSDTSLKAIIEDDTIVESEPLIASRKRDLVVNGIASSKKLIPEEAIKEIEQLGRLFERNLRSNSNPHPTS